MKEYFDTNHDDVVSLLEIVQFFFHFITKVVLYVILILLVLIFLLFFFYFIDLLYNISSGENKPPLFDAYIIVSPSMVPTINVEDAIIIQRIEPENIKQGDIVLAECKNTKAPVLVLNVLEILEEKKKYKKIIKILEKNKK